MNQILSVDMQNNRSRKPSKKANIKSVIIFFSIILILFGGILVTLGIISNNKSEGNNQNIVTGNEPRIDISQEGVILNVVISGNNAIEKVVYNWNNDNETEIQGEGKTKLDLNIDIPEGTNTLKITVTDIEGLEQNFEKQYQGAEELDVTIELKQDDNNKINIVCESETKIDKISYYFDNEEPKENPVNDYTAEIPLDDIEGDHKLTITVEDVDGKVKTKQADIYMTAITTTLDGNYFTINASNTGGISRVYVYINGEEKTVEVNSTEYEEVIELQDGQNKIGIVVYDINEVKTKKLWAPTK